MLVAMATYSFYRHIIGKVEVGNFLCLNGNIWIILQKCLLIIPQ